MLDFRKVFYPANQHNACVLEYQINGLGRSTTFIAIEVPDNILMQKEATPLPSTSDPV